MNNQHKFKKILIAPLDWGLGHAARCIPLIHEFLNFNCEVTIAASDSSLNLLKAEFPGLKFLNLNAYKITYTKNKRWMAFKVAIQIPKILKAVRLEHNRLKNLIKKESFDAVISDNRYGFYSDAIYSVFITHQLQIITGFKFTDDIIRWLVYRRIKKFDECWIPDFEPSLNISGILAHPVKLPGIPVKYIGALSRFTGIAPSEILYKYFVIVSGPEPQRSIFEKKIFEFAKTSTDKFLIVLGKPSKKNSIKQYFNCTIYNHLSTKELSKAFAESEYVISRCGYTTVMDVLTLKKKSVLIPTPGQTEQEYLAAHLAHQNWCYTFSQADDFKKHLKKAETFNYVLPDIDAGQYKKFVQKFVETL